MSKNILFYFFHLLVLLSFLNFSFSSQSCGLSPPKNAESCYMDDDDDEHNQRCCYFEGSDGKSYCQLFEKSEINDSITCPSSHDKDLPGASCGPSNPENADQCKNSTQDVSHPCCYYHNGNFKKCFSIGKVDTSVLYTYDNNIIDCFSKYYKINYLVFIFIMIMFI